MSGPSKACIDSLAAQIFDHDAWAIGNIIGWQEQGDNCKDYFRGLARQCLQKASPATTPPEAGNRGSGEVTREQIERALTPAMPEGRA